MLEKIKDILYDLSDFITTFVIVGIIIISISSIMSSTFGIDLQNNVSTNMIAEQNKKIDEKKNKENSESKDTNVSETNTDENNKTSENNNTDTNNDESSNKKEQEENNKPVQNTDQNENNQEGQTNEQNNSSTDNSTTNEQNNEVTIEIVSGQSASQLANNLFEKEIIKDKQKFLNYLSENQLDTQIKPGKFKLKKGMTLGDVATTLFN